MRPAQEALLALVDRIFSDGIVTASEKRELVSLYRDAALTVPEVRSVFMAFLQQTWGEAIADGVLSVPERDKLKAIVRELRLPVDCLPDIITHIVRAA